MTFTASIDDISASPDCAQSGGEAYWRYALKGFKAATPLVVDRTNLSRPAVKAARTGQRRPLTAETMAAVRQLERRQGVRLDTLLPAAWAILLSRYSGEADITFGIIWRESSGGPDALEAARRGATRVLPMRVAVDGETTLASWLGRLQAQQYEMRRHADCLPERPGELSESAAGRLLFESVVDCAGGDAGETDARQNQSDDPARGREGFAGMASYPLVVRVDGQEGPALAIEYDAERFEAGAVGCMLGHLQTLIKALAADEPRRRVAQLPLLTAAEKRLLAEWNETSAEYPSVCLHQLFEEQAGRTPEAAAVVFEGAQICYRELNERANRLARRLRRLGVRQDSMVGVCVERSVEMVVALLGVLKAGGAYVPMDPQYPAERLAFMLADCRASVLLTERRLRDALPPTGARVLCLDADWQSVSEESGENLGVEVAGGNLAYVIYTSGSTGAPKGAMNTHAGICNRLLWMQNAYRLDATDCVLQKTPFSFDVSVWEFFWPLTTGARLVVARPGGHHDGSYLTEVIARERVTTLHFVPSMLQSFLEEEDLARCASLRRVICSGEALPYELQRRFFARLDAELHNLYGPTEAAVDVTSWECERESRESIVPIGRPVANTEIYVLDRHLNQLPVGVPGELYVGGVQLARGYLWRADLTAERFIPHPHGRGAGARLYRTGDLARFLPDGNVEFLGRLDHQIKIRGVRIELGEVEAALAAHEGVRECVVAARDDDGGGKRLAAYVVPREGARGVSAGELRAHLMRSLPGYMLPQAFVELDALPLLPNGKVDRGSLPEPDFTGQEAGAAFVAPRNRAEELLAAAWSQLLGVERVGVEDDFFALGGQSITAARVGARVHAALGVELTLRDFFEAPTVARLAARIESRVRADESVKVKNAVTKAAKNIAELSPAERAALVMRLKKKKAAEASSGRVIPRRGEAAHHPLSFAQQRLWFLEQLEPNGPYKVPAAFSLRGRLNIEALEQSLNEIVRRHEVLRTTFAEIEGRPVQIVRPQLTLALPFADLSRLTEAKRAEEIKRAGARMIDQPFDFVRGPLVRAALLRLGEEEYLFWFLMHHIVSDGWSIGVLVKELSAAYEAFTAGRRPTLEELPIQYADFAVWQREWLQGEVLERQIKYWKEHLGGKLPVLELPTDRPRPPVQTYRGAFLTRLIDLGLTERLKELARREGVTPYMLLLAAFKTLLHRYTGQSDIVVGTPIANRNWADVEALIGFFVNTLVLRTDVSGDPSFRELLGPVREVTLGAYAHQDLPFEKLVEELQPERDASRTPLFQVMFSMQNSPMPPMDMGGLKVSLIDDDTTVSQFDLSFDVIERADGLLCGLEYNTDLFDGATVARMLKHFAVLLDAATAAPDTRLSALPLLTDEERRQLLVEWNDTRRDYPRGKCVDELFEEQAERTPDAVALTCGEERLTYAELNGRANQMARHLRALGVGAESRVGVLLERSATAAAALLGVVKAGGAWVALDASYPRERLQLMLDDAGASVLLTTAELAASLPAHGARVVRLDAEADDIAAHGDGDLGRLGDPRNLAYVVYTSGTTGRPKGILVEHRSLVNTCLAFAAHHGVTSGDRLLQFASLSFDVAAEEFFAAWLSGARAVMRPEGAFDTIGQFARFVEREGVTLANLPASFWAEWLATLDERGSSAAADGTTPNAPLPSTLRRVVVGNEKTLSETLGRWHRLVGDRIEWSNAYGPSETTVTASNYEPSGVTETDAARPRTHAAPIGRPIANAELYVLDARQQIVPVGVIGEIYIGGEGVARGYHRGPAQTAERFMPHPFSASPGARLYRTGDLARFLPDGNVEFLGRADEQVKVRGFRIEVGEVEAVLQQHPEVREGVVAARDDGRGGAWLVAYVVPRAPAAAAPGDLRNFLKERLPEYMIPAAFVRLEALPLTPNGKVDRKALPAPNGASREAEEAYVAPRSELERTIAAIWREVLGVEKVGVHDNFFGLGGHSLLMIRVNSKLREAVSSELPIIEMFKYPTVSALAEHLSGPRDATDEPARASAESRAELVGRRRELMRRQTARPPHRGTEGENG